MDSYGFSLECDETLPKLLESNEALTNAAWDGFLRGSAVETSTLNEILPLIWHHGCPRSQRARIWMHLSGAAELRANGCEDTSYTDLASRANHNLPYRTLHQIELDLPRTFSNHADFREAAVSYEAQQLNLGCESSVRKAAKSMQQRNAMQCLRRILRTIAATCAPVGYTQGMNFVAGFALLVMRGECAGGEFSPGQEEDAFWFTLALFTRVLPGFYAEDMPTVRVACGVLQAQLQSILPGVESVMSVSGLPVSALAPRWLLCLWLNACPSPVAAHLWDFMLLSHAGGAVQEQGSAWETTPLNAVPLAQGGSCAGLRCLLGTVVGMLRLHQCDIMQCTEAGAGLDSTIAALGTLQAIGAQCSDALPVLQYAFSGACHVQPQEVQAAWTAAHTSTLQEGGDSHSMPLAAQVSWLEPTAATARLAKTPARAGTPPPQTAAPTPPFSPLKSPPLKLPQRTSALQHTTPLALAAMMGRSAAAGGAFASPLQRATTPRQGATPPVLLPPLVVSPGMHSSPAGTPLSPAMALFGTPPSAAAAPAEQGAGNRTPLQRSPAPRRRRQPHAAEPVHMPATPLACAHTPGHRHPLASPAAALEDALLGVAEGLQLPHDTALRVAGPFGFGALCPMHLYAGAGAHGGVADAFRLHPAPTASPAAPAPGARGTASRDEPAMPPTAAVFRMATGVLEADDRSYLAVASALAHVSGSPATQRTSNAAAQQLAAKRRPLQAINKLFSPKHKQQEKRLGASMTTRAVFSGADEGILLSPVRKPVARR